MIENNQEVLFQVIRIFSEKDQEWLPAIKDTSAHDFDPVWVAALMYLMLDRYVSNIDDEAQPDFVEKVYKIFEVMKENGQHYMEKLKVQ
jgi:hypothetical protein